MINQTSSSSESKFRIFISYAHEDRELVEKHIIIILQKIGLQPIWDRNILPGTPFSDVIKDFIAHSHIFMPIITTNAQKRPWVHQETGYAIAMNIPILPIAIGNLPSEMIAELHAISVPENLEGLDQCLQEINMERIIFPSPRRPHGVFEIADWPEKRTEMIVQYANWVADLGSYSQVRLRAGFSSFSIPDKDIYDPIWKDLDGDSLRSDYYHYLQREERQILERHARGCGCRLIISPKLATPSVAGPLTKKTRLLVLMNFLERMPDDKIEIAIIPEVRVSNLIIVGNYFVAESLVPRPGGYLQTVFNSHPPTVLQQARKFDEEFDQLYVQNDFASGTSRTAVIEQIRQLLAESN